MSAPPLPAVLIRADGGEEIGGGHMARAKIVSDALMADGCLVHLLTKDNPWTRAIRDRYHCKVHFLRPAENESLVVLQTARRMGARLIILDVRDTSAEYVRYLQESGAPVITIDDEGRGADMADATFRAGTTTRREKNYYRGPSFAILSPAIAGLRAKSTAPGQVRAVAIFLGTFDPMNFGKSIPEVIDHFPQITFQWFTGSDVAPKSNLQKIPPHQDVFFRTLIDSDLALVSGGVTLFETAALGRPAIVLPQNDPERRQTELFTAAGAVEMISSPGADRIIQAIESLAAAPGRLARMRERGMELVDGRGLDRFREVVRRVLARASIHA